MDPYDSKLRFFSVAGFFWAGALAMVICLAGSNIVFSQTQAPIPGPVNCDSCGPPNVSGRTPEHTTIAPILNATTNGPAHFDRTADGQMVPSSLNGAAVSDSTSTSWQQVPFVGRTAVTPIPRNNAAVAYDEARGVVVVFGGRHYELINGNWAVSDLGDTWTWDGRTWTQQQPTNKPPPRSFTTMAYHPGLGKVVLFGGWCLSCGDYLNDTWEWDGSNWTKINTPVAPPSRIGGSIAYDAAHNQFVLFGGQVVIGGVSQRVADTWIFDGSNWTQALLPASPTPRSGDANLMTYVPANHGLILFGGTTAGATTFNDTWLWDGTTWNRLSPTNSPPPSFSPSIVYDAASASAVLFRSEGETWTWDGQNWQQAAALSPPSRFGSVYAYDAAVGKVLMYSGANCLPQFDDEYLWNGISWSQVDLGDRFPPQRTYSQMSFDAARDQAVLFSGVRDGCSFLRDTWTWNGASWTWLHPQNNPPSRAWSSMAYYRQHNDSVLF